MDGAPVGEGQVKATVPMMFSADETTDLGVDTASPVSDGYTPRQGVFNGRGEHDDGGLSSLFGCSLSRLRGGTHPEVPIRHFLIP